MKVSSIALVCMLLGLAGTSSFVAAQEPPTPWGIPGLTEPAEIDSSFYDFLDSALFPQDEVGLYRVVAIMEEDPPTTSEESMQRQWDLLKAYYDAYAGPEIGLTPFGTAMELAKGIERSHLRIEDGGTLPEQFWIEATQVLPITRYADEIAEAIDGRSADPFRPDPTLTELEQYYSAAQAIVGIPLDAASVIGGVYGIFRPAPTPILDDVIEGAEPIVGRGVWDLPPFDRGRAIEIELGQNLPVSFETFDKFEDGVATSIKSIDLAAETYVVRPGQITSKLKGYVDEIAEFTDARVGDVIIDASDISTRGLLVAVPPGATAGQTAALDRAITYGAERGVVVVILEHP